MSYKVKGGKVIKDNKVAINLHEIDSECDIQVDAKGSQYVMLIANAVGRRVVEDAFPDVEWATDEIHSRPSEERAPERIANPPADNVVPLREAAS
jgi:hypothetical protein